jgi:dihydropteroate synthase
MKGTPTDMQNDPTYEDLIPDIIAFLQDAITRATQSGINENVLIIDPGIGFGKTFNHNLKILRDLSLFKDLERPILLGSSRKAFIGHILNKEPLERDIGTMATVAVGIMNGAHIVRVHNVKAAMETIQVMDAIKSGSVD